MGEESRIVAQDCGSGTEWTHHAGAGQRPLSTQRRGAGVGGSVGHHAVVPAVVLSQPEPHRTTLEVHEASRPIRSLPPDFPGLSSRHPRGSRRFVNQVLPATGLVDDAEFPAIRRRLTHGRVRYTSVSRCKQKTTSRSFATWSGKPCVQTSWSKRNRGVGRVCAVWSAKTRRSPSSRRGLCHAPPIGCNLSTAANGSRSEWRRCGVASIAVGPSAI